jgi:site-specific recombinase XerD
MTPHPLHDLLIAYTAWGVGTRGWSDRTAYDYRLRCEHADTWLRSHRSVTLPDAQRLDVEAFLLATCHSPSGRNGVLQAIRACHQYLVDQEARVDDATATVKRLKQPAGLPRPLAHDRAVGVLAAARSAGPMWRAMTAVLLHTAIRRHEVLYLAWEDITDGWIQFRAKGGRDRSLPLHAEALAALEAWRPLCPSRRWVFPSPVDVRKPLSTTMMAKKIAKIGDEAGVHLHPHRLRHTAATQLVERGADLRAVQAILGHASLKTTSVYVQVRDARLVEAVALLDYAG